MRKEIALLTTTDVIDTSYKPYKRWKLATLVRKLHS